MARVCQNLFLDIGQWRQQLEGGFIASHTYREGPFFDLCLGGWEATLHSFLILPFSKKEKASVSEVGENRWAVKEED